MRSLFDFAVRLVPSPMAQAVVNRERSLLSFTSEIMAFAL